jgi:HAD superfamily hydrolase (TIGR01484 family)
MVKDIKAIVATDLDGTLLTGASVCSEKNLAMLEALGRLPALRVVATGRSLYSVRKTLPPEFPIDVLVFSSGAGIWDWKKDSLIEQNIMNRDSALEVAETLKRNHLSFMAHHPIPENHRFWFFENLDLPPDFQRRCEMHGELASRWHGDFPQEGVTQFIVMVRTANAAEQLVRLRELIPHLSVVRATSPWNPEITWLEVFPKGISKGHALSWIVDRYGWSALPTFGLGNDFNDIELLDWASDGFVVANAPEELLKKYLNAPDNESDGFFYAVTDWLASRSLVAATSLSSAFE